MDTTQIGYIHTMQYYTATKIWITDTCINIDDSQMHAKQMKLVTKQYIEFINQSYPSWEVEGCLMSTEHHKTWIHSHRWWDHELPSPQVLRAVCLPERKFSSFTTVSN